MSLNDLSKSRKWILAIPPVDQPQVDVGRILGGNMALRSSRTLIEVLRSTIQRIEGSETGMKESLLFRELKRSILRSIAELEIKKSSGDDSVGMG